MDESEAIEIKRQIAECEAKLAAPGVRADVVLTASIERLLREHRTRLRAFEYEPTPISSLPSEEPVPTGAPPVIDPAARPTSAGNSKLLTMPKELLLFGASKGDASRNSPASPTTVPSAPQVAPISAETPHSETRRPMYSRNSSVSRLRGERWAAAAGKYRSGMMVKGRLCKMFPFGLLVELEPGLAGLLHNSEIGDPQLAGPNSTFQLGEELNVRVLRVDLAEEKIVLSLRQEEIPPLGGNAPDESRGKTGQSPVGAATSDVVAPAPATATVDPPSRTELRGSTRPARPRHEKYFHLLPTGIADELRSFRFDEDFHLTDVFLRFSFKLLWHILSVCHSEAVALGRGGERLEKILTVLTTDQIEFPCEQVEQIKNLLRDQGLGEDSLYTATRSVSTEHRIAFSARTHLMRTLVLSGQNEARIVSRIDELISLWGSGKTLLTKCAGFCNIAASDLKHDCFPMLLRSIRTMVAHPESSSWLGGHPLPRNAFKQICRTHLWKAIIEWIDAEPWLTKVLPAIYLGRDLGRDWFELNCTGAPVIGLPKAEQRLKRKTRQVIDRESRKYLFPYVPIHPQKTRTYRNAQLQ